MGLIKPIFVLILCNGAKEQELIFPLAPNLDIVVGQWITMIFGLWCRRGLLAYVYSGVFVIQDTE